MEPLERRELFAATPVPKSITPNDPVYPLQWSLPQIQAPEAWKITTGSLSVVVSIHDGGVDYTLPDLYQNIWLNQKEIPFKIGKNGLADTDGDGLITFYDLNARDTKGKLTNGAFVKDRNNTGYIDGGDLLADPKWADGKDQGHNRYVDDLIGWDFTGNDNDPMDDDGHGTFIAGIIGAQGNNRLGITGINWRVQIMAAGIGAGPGFVSLDAAAESIYYAADNGARVSNHSYTGDGDLSEPDPLRDSINYAGRKGLLVVAGAGNEAINIDAFDDDDPTLLPAAYPLSNVISVAATGSNNLDTRGWELSRNENDQLAYFSNYGTKSVALGAPGWDLLSYTGEFDDDSFYHPAGPGITTGDGTSFATPQVAGAAALLLAKYPKLRPADLKRLILDTVDRIPALQGKTATGGRLNVYKAMLAAGNWKAGYAEATSPPFCASKPIEFHWTGRGKKEEAYALIDALLTPRAGSTRA